MHAVREKSTFRFKSTHFQKCYSTVVQQRKREMPMYKKRVKDTIIISTNWLNSYFTIIQAVHI